ncbi:MAG TPA: DnaJ domain-containing protein [Acetobacteraceae bacterium]|nr:DnaJ domain-containing protein [Acetobacteraceae bacterium]
MPAFPGDDGAAMVFFLLGLVTLLVLMGALGAFSRAQIATIKQFGLWVVAIGGLLLAALLLFTGKGLTAIAALAMLGPLVWSWIGETQPKPRMGGGAGGAGRTAGGRPARPRTMMSRAEAYEVLGLAPGAGEAEIRAAHRRLMRAAHPDAGGSDWLATRVNQARDVLLG